MLHIQNLESYFGHQFLKPLIRVPYCLCQSLHNLLDLSYTLGLILWLSKFQDDCASNLLKSPLWLPQWYYTVLHIPIQCVALQSRNHLHFLDVVIVNEADRLYHLVEELVLL